LETGWAEWTWHHAGHGAANARAASVAAIEEEVDVVDAQALVGAAVHGDALHHQATRVDL
jgi:hypothetical protein